MAAASCYKSAIAITRAIIQLRSFLNAVIPRLIFWVGNFFVSLYSVVDRDQAIKASVSGYTSVTPFDDVPPNAPYLVLPHLYYRHTLHTAYILPHIFKPLIFSTPIPYPPVPVANLVFLHASESFRLIQTLQSLSKTLRVLCRPEVHTIFDSYICYYIFIIHYIL